MRRAKRVLAPVALAAVWLTSTGGLPTPDVEPLPLAAAPATFAHVSLPLPTRFEAQAVDDGPVRWVDELPDDAVEIAAAGDVNLGGRVGDTMRSRGWSYPWTAVAPLLRDADIAVVNLECAVSRNGTPEDKEFTFRGDPDSLEGVARAGVDVVSLGNNHAADFGRDALVDTVRHVRNAGLAAVGAGRDRNAAYEPAYIERGDIRFGFVGATRVMPYNFAATDELAGVASAYDEQRLVSAVQQAEREADVVIVAIHWGVELATQPNGVQRSLARALADAGADVILGHHPHVLQPVEGVNGALVAFSLGNFVFTSPTASANQTMLLRVGIRPDGEIVAARVPMRIIGGRPEPTAA